MRQFFFHNHNYLRDTASATDVSHIGVIGPILAANRKRNDTAPCSFGKILNNYRNKKESLKLPNEIAGLTDMRAPLKTQG